MRADVRSASTCLFEDGTVAQWASLNCASHKRGAGGGQLEALHLRRLSAGPLGRPRVAFGSDRSMRLHIVALWHSNTKI